MANYSIFLIIIRLLSRNSYSECGGPLYITSHCIYCILLVKVAKMLVLLSVWELLSAGTTEYRGEHQLRPGCDWQLVWEGSWHISALHWWSSALVMWYDTIQYDTILYNTLWYYTIRYYTIRYDTFCVLFITSCWCMLDLYVQGQLVYQCSLGKCVNLSYSHDTLILVTVMVSFLKINMWINIEWLTFGDV